MLRPYVTRSCVLRLWPLRLPGPDGVLEAVDNAASIDEGELQHGAEAELGPLRVGWLVCRLEELIPAERFVGGHAHPLVHGPAGGDPGRAVPLVHLAVVKALLGRL